MVPPKTTFTMLDTIFSKRKLLQRALRARLSSSIRSISLPSMSDSREARVDRFQFDAQTRAKILGTKRCFILGMGPSLAKFDPAAFEGEVVIGVNRILQTAFSPDIVCVSDPQRLDLKNLSRTKKLVTVSHICQKYSEALEKMPAGVVHGDVEVQFPLSNTWDKVDRLDPHFSRIWWGGAVITDLAIPLAVYLGFQQVNVLGLDEISRSFPVSHTTGHEASAITASADPGLVTHMQERMAFLAKQEKVTVRNISTGGFCFAFPRYTATKVLSNALRTQFNGDVNGRYIAFNGQVLQLIRRGDTEVYSLKNPKGQLLRHRSNMLHLDPDAGSEQMEKDSGFIIEPSFVRPDWISLRSLNMPERYITAVDAPEKYRLRPPSWGFSPYFSSFPLYRTSEEAKARSEMERLLIQANQQVGMIGNMLIAEDARYSAS